MSKATKDNPFSFFAFDKKKPSGAFDSEEEDIFADTPISKPRGPPTSKAPTSTTSSKAKEKNPFSFFKEDTPPPPPNSKQAPKPQSKGVFDSSDDDDWASPSVPAKAKKVLSEGEDDDWASPSVSARTKKVKSEDEDDDDDDWASPSLSAKKKLSESPPPLPGVFPQSPRRSEPSDRSTLEKYKRKSEQSEAMILGYEEKLKQANKKNSEMKEKHLSEMEEMESALRLITKKFEEMQNRAEKAETENAKLRKLVNQQNNSSAQYGPDWKAMNEKSTYAVDTMKKIALQSEQSLNGLLAVKNDFQILMDLLSSMDKISVVHNNSNNGS
eukprot:TRINITY_DN1496_c0_g1_i1.p1 TRINITY_DN1496_c0_g1~~TRINITY_DN1496_c0_g1_i1.p1  ORF type:complete len:327 (-),score=100.08 TRINITY_DN1496_c0_g1_i1:63-1043(-)